MGAPPIAYLDHASTSPLRPEALAAMLPYLAEHYGNPSGSHAVARRARAAVEEARDTVAQVVGTEPGEIVFTSGGTESCNLAVLGAHAASLRTGPRDAGRHGVVRCSAVEHPAVQRACAATGDAGEPLAVDVGGRLDLAVLAEGLGPDTTLVSVMTANNETGVIQPLGDAAALVRDRAPSALVHTDAVGVGAWLDLAGVTAAADLVSLGSHKLGGPKGAGVLVVRGGTRLAPVLHGGPQERDRRPGTHDVAAIVGMAAALGIAHARRAEEAARVAALRDRLAEGLLALPGAKRTVPPDVEVLPGTLHVRFDGVDQQELLVLLDEGWVCASAGAACASGALEPSHVLLAMGLSPAAARTAVRFSLGWSSSAADVEQAVLVVDKALARLRR